MCSVISVSSLVLEATGWCAPKQEDKVDREPGNFTEILDPVKEQGGLSPLSEVSQQHTREEGSEAASEGKGCRDSAAGGISCQVAQAFGF